MNAKMSLYEISEQMAVVDQLLQDVGGDVSEGTDGAALEKWAQEYEWMQKDKVDSYIRFIRTMESASTAIAEEIKTLSAKARVLDNRTSRLMALVRYIMDHRKLKLLEGNTWKFVIQKNGGKIPVEILVEDVEKLPDALVKTTRRADLDAIREALELKNPEALAVAKLGDRGESLRIK